MDYQDWVLLVADWTQLCIGHVSRRPRRTFSGVQHQLCGRALCVRVALVFVGRDTQFEMRRVARVDVRLEIPESAVSGYPAGRSLQKIDTALAVIMDTKTKQPRQYDFASSVTRYL